MRNRQLILLQAIVINLFLSIFLTQLMTEVEALKGKCDRVEEQSTRLKLSNDQWAVTVDQMKEEKNEAS